MRIATTSPMTEPTTNHESYGGRCVDYDEQGYDDKYEPDFHEGG